MQRRSVLLPEPDGPDDAQHLALRNVSDDAVQRRESSPKHLLTSTAMTHAQDVLMRVLRGASAAAAQRPSVASSKMRSRKYWPIDSTVTTTRYQIAGDDQELDDAGVGVVDVLGVAQDLEYWMTLASEVILTMPMNSLPTGGMITRIACGSMIRRSACSRVMPIALAASYWPTSTDSMPATHHLGGVGALIDAEAEQRRDERRDDSTVRARTGRECRWSGRPARG